MHPVRNGGITEYRSDLNGKTYGEIEADESLEQSLDAFQSHTVRTTVIKNWNSDELLYLLFLRLNQNSVTLSAQELRRALYPGGFMNWLDDKTSKSEGMKTIFSSIPDFRMRDMEVSTRFLGFRSFEDSYAGNMKKFLDGTTGSLKKNWPGNEPELNGLWDEYEASIAFTQAIFETDVFQLWSNGKFQLSKNRAVMDIMT